MYRPKYLPLESPSGLRKLRQVKNTQMKGMVHCDSAFKVQLQYRSTTDKRRSRVCETSPFETEKTGKECFTVRHKYGRLPYCVTEFKIPLSEKHRCHLHSSDSTCQSMSTRKNNGKRVSVASSSYALV